MTVGTPSSHLDFTTKSFWAVNSIIVSATVTNLRNDTLIVPKRSITTEEGSTTTFFVITRRVSGSLFYLTKYLLGQHSVGLKKYVFSSWPPRIHCHCNHVTHLHSSKHCTCFQNQLVEITTRMYANSPPRCLNWRLDHVTVESQPEKDARSQATHKITVRLTCTKKKQVQRPEDMPLSRVVLSWDPKRLHRPLSS